MSDTELTVIPHLGSAEFHREPGPALGELHSAGCPRLYRHPYGPELVLVGYDDLQSVLKHPNMQAQNREDRSSGPAVAGKLAALFNAHPVFMDEPRHRPVRMAATAAVGLARSDWFAIQIDEVATELAAELRQAGGGDLVRDFAFALSSRIWCRIVGVPETHAPTVRDCAQRIAIALEFLPDPDDLALADKAASTIVELLLEERRGNGSTSTSEELVREQLTKAPDPDGTAEPLQLLASLTFDAVDGAGGMTGNFLYCLLSHPGALNSARQSLDDLSPFWTEAARLHPPLLGLFRCATEDTGFDGFALPAGQNVLTLNAAGNRDPRIFKHPDAYLPGRPANRPLSFGFGSRGCIGRHLASMQGNLGVRCLLQETGAMQLRLDEPEWGKPGLLRAVQQLPVEFG
ncbi:MAG: cytochrome P450 [Pseudomonadota bacterium]